MSQPEVPPNNPEQDDLFTQAVKAAEAQAQPAEEEIPPPPPASEPVQAPEVTAAPSAPPVEQPKFAPQLLKLMEREAAIVEREKQLREAEEKVKKYQDMSAQLEQAQRLLRTNAPAFVRKFAPDIDPGETAKQLWYEKLGDQAPPEFRAQLDARAASYGIDELRAEMQANQQRMVEEIKREQANAAFNQYVGSLGAYAQSVPDEYPLVKAFAKGNPERVQQGLLKIAQNHAQATGGDVLTPAQAAERLNKELEGLRSVLAPSQPPTAPEVTTAPSGNSLRNKHQSVQPNRALPDPADEEAKFQKAFEAAQALARGTQ